LPLPVGRVNLRASVSGYSNSGFALALKKSPKQLTSAAFRKTQYEEKDGELATAIVIFKGSEKTVFQMAVQPCS
jgi:hypothetical protein